MKATDFDELLDNAEDVRAYLDLSTIRRPNLEARRVNVDFPAWVVDGLDREAARLGVTRQSVIKMWIAEKLGSRPQASCQPIHPPLYDHIQRIPCRGFADIILNPPDHGLPMLGACW